MAWILTLSINEQWALGLAVVLFGGLAAHWLALHRERESAYRTAAEKFRTAFNPALAFLERARLHGSDHDRPDASAFLKDAFVTHSAATKEFRPFVSWIRRKSFDKAWTQYCEIAHAGTVEAEFMAEIINRDDPRKALQDLIHAILRFAKT